MNLSKFWIMGWLVMSLFLTSSATDAHEKKIRHSDTKIVWESDRLFTSWFGNVHRIQVDHDGVPAKWVVVKAGENWSLNVDRITVKYLDRNHDHPVKKDFYPYERIQRGDKVRFQLPERARVLGVKVVTSGWSGSHARDGFRILLKKHTHRPPVDLVRTGYYYGKCIGGRRCPGYSRKHRQQFSIDLEDVRNVKRIHFFSHDNVGHSHNAKLNVYVDDERVAHHLDIKSRGSQHTIELDKVFGRHITFEATHRDEAVIQRITVDYSDYQTEGRRKHYKRNKGHDRHEGQERHKHDRRDGHDERDRRGHFPR